MRGELTPRQRLAWDLVEDARLQNPDIAIAGVLKKRGISLGTYYTALKRLKAPIRRKKQSAPMQTLVVPEASPRDTAILMIVSIDNISKAIKQLQGE